MALWIDIKYANILGDKLTKFKLKSRSPYIANYRCPFCDDIEEKKRARGYLLEKEGKIFNYCHNCGSSMSLSNFIQSIDAHLFREYRLETIKERWVESKTENKIVFAKPVFKHEIKLGTPIINCINSEAYNYIFSRKIPTIFYNSIYYFKDINDLTKQIEKYKNTQFSKESIIAIPFFNAKREYSYISCRAISPTSSFRYYTLEINNIHPKIWGLETIDWNKPVFIFEGPIDAMCIPNSIAMAGVGGNDNLNFITSKKKENKEICFVYDSDYLYNKEVFKQVQKRINEGFSVIVYDFNFPGKDVNEVLCNGIMTIDEIYKYLQQRSFNGLRAQIELTYYSKTHKF